MGVGDRYTRPGTQRRPPPCAASEDTLEAVARAYSTFATKNPTLYEAMFTRATRLRFGAEDTAAPLSAAYAELRAAIATTAGERDVDTLTEVIWTALHGLTTLAGNDRLRPGHDTDRVDLLIAQFRTARSKHLSEQP